MNLRTRFCLAFMVLLLLPCIALAEVRLSLSADCIAAGSVLDFTVSGGKAEAYRYTMYRNGEELFTHDTPLTFGSYLPRQSGQYTLKVTLHGESGAITQADFTVTDPMTCALPELPDQLSVGEPLYPLPQVTGGTGEYTYVYTITGPDGAAAAWMAGPDWHWVPALEGTYTLKISVSDPTGAQAEAEAAITVTPGPGITLRNACGSLLAHGGQQSWTVYAPGDWSASTNDDFITLETSSGVSGSTLCITIAEPIRHSRQGSITITSSAHRIVWPVLQSASHGVDEEISLSPAILPLLADGQAHAVWLNAQDSRSFSISAIESWDTELACDFIQLESTEGKLTLTVDPPLTVARTGMVAIHSENSSAYIHVYQPAAPAEIPLATAITPEETASVFTIYSQSSGYWKDKAYGASTLEHSGCAIFALAHALQCLGYEGEEITPEYLAANYAFALREGGTINSTLVGNVGDDLGYKTRYELYKSLPTIQAKLAEGAVFSFEVANGHIAMVAGQSEDGAMFRIIDSAPSATWKRIKNAQFHRREADGSFTPITDLTQLAGIRYYIETGSFGGAEYWLEASYVARRGVRLIQLRN